MDENNKNIQNDPVHSVLEQQPQQQAPQQQPSKYQQNYIAIDKKIQFKIVLALMLFGVINVVSYVQTKTEGPIKAVMIIIGFAGVIAVITLGIQILRYGLKNRKK